MIKWQTSTNWMPNVEMCNANSGDAMIENKQFDAAATFNKCQI